ncbi:MAG: ABC transporter ATP-binding protein [Buchananella hordeovulneris]|nr:ABC transporter ATP-binding protein [Buchananella hordeovulneris]
MIKAEGLTKRYGTKLAVDNISFEISAGCVTGFLGPNGAGKSTTMRMIMGLDTPTAGTVTVNGKPFRQHSNPAQQVGALLDAKGIHPGRSARAHLKALALSNNIPLRRVDEVLELTGLTEVAKRRAGGFSLGMGQRLGIAAALLGDPQVLIFDEPVNGLDPEGVRWVRQMCRSLAEQGRTVFVSSHLMSEMAQTADHLLVIGKGRILTHGPVDEVIAAVTSTSVVVRSPRLADLGQLLVNAGAGVADRGDGALTLTGIEAPVVGELAAQHGLPLHELTTVKASLEEAYLTLTADQVEYRTTQMGEIR